VFGEGAVAQVGGDLAIETPGVRWAAVFLAAGTSACWGGVVDEGAAQVGSCGYGGSGRRAAWGRPGRSMRAE